jgi:hypothetical protein
MARGHGLGEVRGQLAFDVRALGASQAGHA